MCCDARQEGHSEALSKGVLGPRGWLSAVGVPLSTLQGTSKFNHH